jgi:hypothetical protein
MTDVEDHKAASDSETVVENELKVLDETVEGILDKQEPEADGSAEEVEPVEVEYDAKSNAGDEETEPAVEIENGGEDELPEIERNDEQNQIEAKIDQGEAEVVAVENEPESINEKEIEEGESPVEDDKAETDTGRNEGKESEEKVEKSGEGEVSKLIENEREAEVKVQVEPNGAEVVEAEVEAESGKEIDATEESDQSESDGSEGIALSVTDENKTTDNEKDVKENGENATLGDRTEITEIKEKR